MTGQSRRSSKQLKQHKETVDSDFFEECLIKKNYARSVWYQKLFVLWLKLIVYELLSLPSFNLSYYPIFMNTKSWNN